MSRVRATHNGPALLRKLKLAQESGSSASYLIDDGPGLLDKASKLRGFVKEQRQRTDTSSAKSSWMTMQMQLQAEDKALEGEVATLIVKAIASGALDGSESQDLVEIQAEMQAAAEGIVQLQSELQDSMGQLASAVHCLRMYSPEQSQPELAAMQQELEPARQGLDLAMAQLARSVQELSMDLVTPSALLNTDDTQRTVTSTGSCFSVDTCSTLSNRGNKQVTGRNNLSATAELDDIISRFPLAAGDVKHRIREVFSVLQERFIYKLDTVKLEGMLLSQRFSSGELPPTNYNQTTYSCKQPVTVSTGTSANSHAKQQHVPSDKSNIGRPTITASHTTLQPSQHPKAMTATLISPAVASSESQALLSTALSKQHTSESSIVAGRRAAAVPVLQVGEQASADQPLGSDGAHVFLTCVDVRVVQRPLTESLQQQQDQQQQQQTQQQDEKEQKRKADYMSVINEQAAAFEDAGFRSELTEHDQPDDSSVDWEHTPRSIVSEYHHHAYEDGQECEPEGENAVGIGLVDGLHGHGTITTAGGWDNDEHSMFVSLRAHVVKQRGVKGGREAVMQRVALLLPGRSLDEVMAHDEWYQSARIVGTRRAETLEAWARERRQFLEDASHFLHESATNSESKAEAAAEKLVREILREHTHQELGVLRAQRAAEVEAGQAELMEQQARKAVADAEAAARQLDEAVATKQLIADYRNDMGVRRNQELLVAAHAAHVKADVAHAQAATNKERVEWRISEYIGKLGQQKELHQAQAAEDAAREVRLDKLRALVAPHVAADPARLLQATLASSAAPEDPNGTAFLPLNGYSNDQVYRDQRAKLSEALTKHGLQNTAYGRQVIGEARPAVAPRPDNMTFEQRAHMGGTYAGGL